MRDGRYFHLPTSLEFPFVHGLVPDDLPPNTLQALQQREVIVPTAQPPMALSPVVHPVPSHSLLEMEQEESPCGIGEIFEVCADVTRIQKHLKSQSLLSLLEAMAAPISPSSVDTDIHYFALRQRRARRYSFVDTICLLDSLALLAFLRRRGHTATLVFAVNLTPFGAHCWVEHDGIILNDTLGSTQTFLPIRIMR